MNRGKVLITGITGQDGSYLAELLLNLGYQVAGIVRDKKKLGNIKHLQKKVKLFEADLTEFNKLRLIISSFKPSQIYNLGAVTSLAAFTQNQSYAVKVTEEAPRVIFDAALDLKNRGQNIRIFQASSCLIFGTPDTCPQNEDTPRNPNTSYAESKLRVDLYAKKLRENEKLHISCGILFNHESPRRPLDYVTRKITAAAACIFNKVRKIPTDSLGNPILTEDFRLKLRNINTKRDWGDARDFVKAFLLMLEQDIASDYVIATGKTHSVRDVLEISFGLLDLNWHDYIIEDKESMRSIDTDMLCGNATKAKLKLGWIPQIKFRDTIREMVENDVKIFSN